MTGYVRARLLHPDIPGWLLVHCSFLDAVCWESLVGVHRGRCWRLVPGLVRADALQLDNAARKVHGRLKSRAEAQAVKSRCPGELAPVRGWVVFLPVPVLKS